MQPTNGGAYRFPLEGWRLRLAIRFQNTFVGQFVSLFCASPVVSALVAVTIGWTAVQFLSLLFVEANSTQWLSVFVLESANPQYVWTYLTSMFSHGSSIHLLVNMVVFLMFGPFVAHRMGSRRFLVLYFAAGLAAGLGQVAVAQYAGAEMGLVGASGAIAGVLGAYTLYEPETRVYLLFLIPLRMGVAGPLFIVGSTLLVLVAGVGAFGIAHTAHILGYLVGVGVVLGYRYPDERTETEKAGVL
jgi:membrane associated rhomboid family serine protease